MNIKKTLLVLITISIILLVYSRCDNNNYYDDRLEVYLITSVADCAECDVFFKVTNVNSETYLFLKNQYILPVCQSQKCEDLLYRIQDFDTIRTFMVEGYLSKQPHGIRDYGCPQTHSFKIVSIEEIGNVPNPDNSE